MPPVRRLTAILAADVAGYSRLMGADEEGTHDRLNAHLRELVNPKIAEHRGRIVKNTGDGLLAEFQSVVDAVRCAAEVQRGMAERNEGTLPEQRIEFRVGINLGDVIAEEHDIFGDGVNVAARLEALAEPGGICVSRVVRDQVRDRLDYAFEDLGDHQVKNIARPVRVYRVLLSETARTKAPLPLPDKLSTQPNFPYLRALLNEDKTETERFLVVENSKSKPIQHVEIVLQEASGEKLVAYLFRAAILYQDGSQFIPVGATHTLRIGVGLYSVIINTLEGSFREFLTLKMDDGALKQKIEVYKSLPKGQGGVLDLLLYEEE